MWKLKPEYHSARQKQKKSSTTNYLLFVEHPPVYTLGKTGHEENILLGEKELNEKGNSFVKTNRGGDITFHGPEQIVGYPILDLEKFGTDIGKYLRNLEEIIIQDTWRSMVFRGEIQWRNRRLAGTRNVRVKREKLRLSASGAADGLRCMGLRSTLILISCILTISFLVVLKINK